MAVPKRLRSEILKRDGHACRHCGARPPDVVLTIDHLIPVALGGTDDPTNLQALCKDCNAGKSSSNPDAATVAQVAEDAERWAAAVKLAAERAQKGDEAIRERLEAIEAHWDRAIPSYWRSYPRYRLPSNWAESVGKLLAAGLPDVMVLDSIDVATSKQPAPDNVFRYAVGVANVKLGKLQEQAAAILAAEEASQPAQDGPSPCPECKQAHEGVCGWWWGWRTGLLDCSTIHTDTTAADWAHPDHFQAMALSRVVDRVAHEWAATWPYPSELYPTYSGRTASGR